MKNLNQHLKPWLAAVTILLLDGCEKQPDKIIVDSTITVEVGETQRLYALVTPTWISSTLSWKSNRPEIATVDSDTGEITGVAPGQATVTITAKRGDASAQTLVTVVHNILTSRFIPDDNLRQWLEWQMQANNWDLNGDGMLSMEEAAMVKSLNIKSLAFTEPSMEGLEYFTGVEELDCTGVIIPTLDLSFMPKLRKLTCHGCELTALDVLKNIALTELYCGSLTRISSGTMETHYNNLTSLDISNNPNLTALNLYGNPGDGTKFMVKAWFDNTAIPENFPTSWPLADGTTITVNYQTGASR